MKMQPKHIPLCPPAAALLPLGNNHNIPFSMRYALQLGGRSLALCFQQSEDFEDFRDIVASFRQMNRDAYRAHSRFTQKAHAAATLSSSWSPLTVSLFQILLNERKVWALRPLEGDLDSSFGQMKPSFVFLGSVH